jgi:hypothetical protein
VSARKESGYFAYEEDSAALWQQLVGRAMVAAAAKTSGKVVFDDGLGDGTITALPPWAFGDNLGRPAPDFVYLAAEESWVWCVDAKYKWFHDGRPKTDDAYQLFAYSHLVAAKATGRRPLDLALVYPASGVSSLRRSGPFLRQPQSGSQTTPVRLFSIAARFPTVEDVGSDSAWGRYLDGCVNDLSEAAEHCRQGR